MIGFWTLIVASTFVALYGFFVGKSLFETAETGNIIAVLIGIGAFAITAINNDAYFSLHENKKQFFIPEGFAHGYLVLSDYAEFAYKCSDYYHPDDEGGIKYDDPDVGIEWPFEKNVDIVLSDKDQHWASFREYVEGCK